MVGDEGLVVPKVQMIPKISSRNRTTPTNRVASLLAQWARSGLLPIRSYSASRKSDGEDPHWQSLEGDCGGGANDDG